MLHNGKWDEFLENLLSDIIEKHRTSNEYHRQRLSQIDELMTTNLTTDQKFLVDDILFEFGLEAEREMEIVYRQGLKDCVWMLKSLGVFA